MKYLFIVCIVLSLLGGLTFSAVTGDTVMFFVPFIVNFAEFGIIAAAYKFLTKDDKEKEYSSYRSVHSL